MQTSDYSPGVSLASLLASRRFFQTDDIVVSACCTDHERCRPGDLFVALPTSPPAEEERTAEAVQRGAHAVLTERLLPIQVPQCIVPDARRALGQLCQRLAGNPGEQISVMGVFGDAGGRPTQLLLKSLLEKVKQRPAMLSQLGFTDGLETWTPKSSARLSAARTATWLANTVANGCTHALAELSQADVMNRHFESVPFSCLVLPGFESVTQASTPRIDAGIRRAIAQLSPQGIVVANVDCPIVRSLIPTIDRPVLTVATKSPADLTATLIERMPSEQTFLLDAGDETAVVRTHIIGDEHISHCLLSVAAGLGLGHKLSVVTSAIESVQKIPGHLERVECGQPFSLFTDAAESPNDLRTVLKTLRGVTKGRLICVFGQGQSGQSASSAQRGRIVERFADLGVITSDDPQDLEPLRATHDVLDGYQRPARERVLPNRIRAIEWVIDEAKPNDTVLIAGPHNQLLVRGEDDFLPDADVARYWLYRAATGKHETAAEPEEQEPNTNI